jgi:hypothetical protein
MSLLLKTLNLETRLLILLVAFLAAVFATYAVDQSLGIERGSWQYAISIGVIAAVAGYTWRLTAPKDKPPSPSN